MFLGFLMMGMAGGMMAGTTALILGHSLGMALAVYALTGVACTALGAIASLIPSPQARSGHFGETGPMVIEG